MMASHTTSFVNRANRERHKPPTGPPPADVLSVVGADHEPAHLAEALRQSERKRHALLSAISELIFVVAKDGTLLEFHAPADNDYALSAEGLVGKAVKELLPAQIGLQAMYYVEKVLRTGQTQIATYQMQMACGVRHFEARAAVYEADKVIALVRDVTDRTYLEKEILEISHREQLRIGQDLHDGLGQHLTGITFLAKALERKLAARSLPEAADAAEVNRLVLQALSQTRSLARGLFPVELESRGLLPAFRELAERVHQMFNVACVFEGDTSIVLTNQAVALHLFRLTQEAISNSVRHGKAKRIVMELKKTGDQGVLTIRDDGTGFPSGTATDKGLGLRIMNYRAQRIGGTLEVEPAAGSGTVVRCSFCDQPNEL